MLQLLGFQPGSLREPETCPPPLTPLLSAALLPCLMSCPALPCLLGVGIEGEALKMVWVVACCIITAGGFKRTSGFTEFYGTCKEGRLTRNNMPPPTNPNMDYQPLRNARRT